MISVYALKSGNEFPVDFRILKRFFNQFIEQQHQGIWFFISPSMSCHLQCLPDIMQPCTKCVCVIRNSDVMAQRLMLCHHLP